MVDIISMLMNIPKDLMVQAQLENKSCSSLVSAVENMAESVPVQSHKVIIINLFILEIWEKFVMFCCLGCYCI